MRTCRVLSCLLACAPLLQALPAPEARLAAGTGAQSGTVVLDWDPVPGAGLYLIHGRTDPGAPRVLLATVTAAPFVYPAAGGRMLFTVTARGSDTGWPLQPAPVPPHAAADVISLFSAVYTSIPVDTWSAPWDQADVQEVSIGGDAVKLFTNLTFSGTEFVSHAVDASGMTHFHLDLWTPDPTAPPATFRVKLVDFGADGSYGGGNDSESELELHAGSQPPLASGQWVGYTIPLTAFAGLASTGHLAQLLFSGDPDSVFVDNLYFLDDPGYALPTEPEWPAPVPLHDAGSVVSLFSDAYTDHPVDTWSAPWDQADVEERLIGGNALKHYTNLGYAGIECVTFPVDASAMSHLHLDVWTAEPTAPPAVLRIKLVDFGANGVWNGGGDDVEHELAIDAGWNPPLQRRTWVGLDIPLAAFTGLVTRQHLAQVILSGTLGSVWLDNLYLHDSCEPWTPPAAAAGGNSPRSALRENRDLVVVWEDDFDGPAGQLPDPARWGYDIGTGWGNAQLEYDTARPQNVSLDGNGRLRITALREDYQGSAYTSARIVTRGLFEPTFGRVEARLQLPSGQGIWPAFWLLGANIDQVSWPQCGEIDIMEARGQEPDLNHGSAHGPGYSGGACFTNTFRLPGAGFHQGFHRFAVEWAPGSIRWFVDDQLYGEATPADVSGAWAFDHPFYLILNLAVGGGFVGAPGECTRFPQTLLVDWVRVSQESR